MTEYAPAAIQHMFDTLNAAIPQAVLAGIVGDSAHTYGYHRGRNYVGSNDYSVQTPPDKKGNGEAASAIDLSWEQASWQYTVSQRLLNAKNDSRMNPIREFFGSVDGIHVCGWDYYGNYSVTSDDSHLWHIHISVLREYADNDAALQGVAQVLIGSTQPPPSTGDWFDMATQADLETVVRRVLNEGTGYGTSGWAKTNQNMYDRTGDIINKLNAMKSQITSEAQMNRWGDGRDVPPGSDTHPWNLKVVRQLCLDILAALPAE